ncbi:hypothetical protein CBF34_07630 [Vagococcus penaei]|uniref:Uncharacterized protein n=1 Tax=Vagococcus penaei TaxID=633807 RepID=A0A1Q2D468_9ENTE|nr:hypothetical protein BW732_02215 [Vagococcus penaei]RSU00964.1 hypothetical protein CBF34_07630 [Vagococcus penaei]
MSHNNCIRISLDLKDTNIYFDSIFCEENVIKGVKSKIFKGTLTYKPLACPCCGIKNEDYSIVKNGFGMATLFLTNIIRCQNIGTVIRLPLTMSLSNCDSFAVC